jgi:hypothetical protein
MQLPSYTFIPSLNEPEVAFQAVMKWIMTSGLEWAGQSFARETFLATLDEKMKDGQIVCEINHDRDGKKHYSWYPWTNGLSAWGRHSDQAPPDIDSMRVIERPYECDQDGVLHLIDLLFGALPKGHPAVLNRNLILESVRHSDSLVPAVLEAVHNGFRQHMVEGGTQPVAQRLENGAKFLRQNLDYFYRYTYQLNAWTAGDYALRSVLLERSMAQPVDFQLQVFKALHTLVNPHCDYLRALRAVDHGPEFLQGAAEHLQDLAEDNLVVKAKGALSQEWFISMLFLAYPLHKAAYLVFNCLAETDPQSFSKEKNFCDERLTVIGTSIDNNAQNALNAGPMNRHRNEVMAAFQNGGRSAARTALHNILEVKLFYPKAWTDFLLGKQKDALYLDRNEMVRMVNYAELLATG